MEEKYTLHDYAVGIGTVIVLISFFWLMFAIAGLMDDTSFNLFKTIIFRGQE